MCAVRLREVAAVMDLDALREALIEHGVDEALQKIRDSEQWEYSHAVEYAATCAAAAVADRAVLDSEEAWRCETHDSPTGDKKIDAASRCFLVIENGGGFAYPCVFEPVSVIRRLLAEDR